MPFVTAIKNMCPRKTIDNRTEKSILRMEVCKVPELCEILYYNTPTYVQLSYKIWALQLL